MFASLQTWCINTLPWIAAAGSDNRLLPALTRLPSQAITKTSSGKSSRHAEEGNPAFCTWQKTPLPLPHSSDSRYNFTATADVETMENIPLQRAADADAWAAKRLLPSGDSLSVALKFAAENQIKGDLPDIAVSPLQGKFLAVQCMLIKAKNALEFGTLGGYSTIWIASSSPEMKVTSIEYDAHHKKVADESIANAGLSDRVQVLQGAGMDVLPQVQKDVSDGKKDKFDFVFIDADKENNTNYVNGAIEVCNPGACIIVDNVGRRGRIAIDEEARMDSRVQGSREVIELAGKDPRLEATLVQTVGDKGYDGFLMCILK